MIESILNTIIIVEASIILLLLASIKTKSEEINSLKKIKQKI